VSGTPPPAGEKINLPSVPIPKVLTKLLTPRGSPPVPSSARTPRTDRSQQLSVRSERSNLLPPPEEDAAPGVAARSSGLLGSTAASSVSSLPRFPAAAANSTRPSVAARSSYARSARSSYARNSYAARDSYAARASWFEYYHRSSQAPPAPSWRTKVQKAVQAVVQHPGKGGAGPWSRAVVGWLPMSEAGAAYE
jgi:hypothetical protein